MQIVKNLGNYETVRLEVECTVEENENVQEAFAQAKNELTTSFEQMYPPKKTLPILKTGTPEFDRVCKSIHDGKADLKLVQQHYSLSQDAITYLKTNKLWK